jgi:ABC-type Mn2+/Zn2+ transport system ATPase subunit
MLESDARITERTIKVKGRKYRQLVIYVPRSLATDSAFPFRPKEMVRISILGSMLNVRKTELPHAVRKVPDTLLPIVEILSPVADNVDGDDNQKKDTG